MTVTANDLVGAWRLVSWSLIYADGRLPEYPLGADAAGLLLYTADGHVGATLMRSQPRGGKPLTDADKARAYDNGFAYAGRYDVRDGTVLHSIEFAVDPALIGVVSTRHIDLDGDRLVLSGPDFVAGTGRTHRIVWRR